jgi:putative tricarboxylic transport membrane protein
MGLGVSVSLSSYRLKLGSLSEPGPGLMPFLLGILLSIFSLSLLLRSLKKHPTGSKDSRGESPWAGVDFKKVVLIFMALVCYAFLLESIGFVLVTFLLLLLLFKIVEPRKWVPALVASTLIAAVAYLLFVTILGVDLPSGVLGRI